MKIIIGLGNPGVNYANTRHNAGMMLVDKLGERIESDYGWRKHYGAMVNRSSELILVKSKEVFMNESGRLIQGLPEGEVWVVHDDLDLRLGEYKIQKGKGPKVHGGVNSLESILGKEFWRVRVGVDNRSEEMKIPGEEYVLHNFGRNERDVLDRVMEEICNEITKTVD